MPKRDRLSASRVDDKDIERVPAPAVDSQSSAGRVLQAPGASSVASCVEDDVARKVEQVIANIIAVSLDLEHLGTVAFDTDDIVAGRQCLPRGKRLLIHK